MSTSQSLIFSIEGMKEVGVVVERAVRWVNDLCSREMPALAQQSINIAPSPHEEHTQKKWLQVVQLPNKFKTSEEIGQKYGLGSTCNSPSPSRHSRLMFSITLADGFQVNGLLSISTSPNVLCSTRKIQGMQSYKRMLQPHNIFLTQNRWHKSLQDIDNDETFAWCGNRQLRLGASVEWYDILKLVRFTFCVSFPSFVSPTKRITVANPRPTSNSPSQHQPQVRPTSCAEISMNILQAANCPETQGTKHISFHLLTRVFTDDSCTHDWDHGRYLDQQ